MRSIVSNSTRLTFEEVLLTLGELKLERQTYRKHVQYHNHNWSKNIFKNFLLLSLNDVVFSRQAKRKELGFYDLVLGTQVYKTEQQYNICSGYNQFYIWFSAKFVRADLVSLSIVYRLYLKIFLHVSSRLSISK